MRSASIGTLESVLLVLVVPIDRRENEIETGTECPATRGGPKGEQCVGGEVAERVFGIADPRAIATSRSFGDAGSAVALLPWALVRRRATNSSADYPTDILGGKYPITSIRDLTTGYDNSKPGNRAVLPVSKSSQMITFTFKNGLVTTIRSSGTEPKIKYYNELCASPDQKDLNELHRILKEMVSAIVEEFLQPEENKLIARGS